MFIFLCLQSFLDCRNCYAICHVPPAWHREGPDTLERRDKLRWTLGHWASVKSRERLAWGDRGDTHFTALYNHYLPVGLRLMWPLYASTVNSLVNMWLSQITWTNTAISVHSSCLENIKPDSHACPGNEVVRHALCSIHTLTYAGIHLINRMWPFNMPLCRDCSHFIHILQQANDSLI